MVRNMKIEVKKFKDALTELLIYLFTAIITIQFDLFESFIIISFIAFISFLIHILIRLYFYFPD